MSAYQQGHAYVLFPIKYLFMYRSLFLITILLAGLLLLQCNTADKQPKPKPKPVKVSNQPKAKTVFKVLPLGKVDQRLINDAVFQLKKHIGTVILLPAEKLPEHAYYKPRNRYRADSLIKWMASKASRGEVYVGLTQKDISTEKGQIKDYGVMGLGFQPGGACVISSFRLRSKQNFYKVVLHEAGHTAGLPHCPVKTCYLRDAKGKDPTGEETGFCNNCTRLLQAKGWTFK